MYKGVAHHPKNIENYLGFSLLTRKRHALFKDKAPALSEGDIVAADYRIINSRSSFDAFVKKFGPPDAVIGVY